MSIGVPAGVDEFKQVITINKKSSDLLDLLAAVIIGVLGMFLSLLGLEANNSIAFGLGLVIEFSAAGYITIKFSNEAWDLINRIRNRNRE